MSALAQPQEAAPVPNAQPARPIPTNARPRPKKPVQSIFNPVALHTGKRVQQPPGASRAGMRPANQGASPRIPVKLEPKIEPKIESDNMSLLDDAGEYDEYTIVSHKRDDGSIYCLMRFKPSSAEETVQLGSMAQPIRMNRKHPRILKPEGEAMDVDLQEPKWRQLKGPDGKLVVGKDGKPAMGATVDGKEMTVAQWHKYIERKKEGDRKPTKAELEAGKGKKGGANGKGGAPFKAKTRQVFSANPLSKHDPQERFPWVLESADEAHSWTGRKQTLDDASTYGILVGTAVGKTMAFVPLTKRYEFVPTKRHAASKTAEAAEAQVSRNFLFSFLVRIHRSSSSARGNPEERQSDLPDEHSF